MLEMNDNAVKPGIAHQDVGASAENESWNTAALNESVQPLKILKVLGTNQQAGRTANTIRGPIFERLVFENVTLNLSAQCLNSQAAWQLDHSVEGLREGHLNGCHDNRTGFDSGVFQFEETGGVNEKAAAQMREVNVIPVEEA